jgi:hypothetical protein
MLEVHRSSQQIVDTWSKKGEQGETDEEDIKYEFKVRACQASWQDIARPRNSFKKGDGFSRS